MIEYIFGMKKEIIIDNLNLLLFFLQKILFELTVKNYYI